jgi:carbon monoxide dehydrogenase subunit G
MIFDSSFEVPLPPERAWPILLDIPRIASCVPGARLTETLDDHTYKGEIDVRLGPVALTFGGTVRFEQVDAAAYRARVKAAGTDAKGRGGANATAAFALEAVPAGTMVKIRTDLTLSGAVGQYGRGAGMIEAVASQLTRQFAQALRAQIEAESVAAPVPTAPASGFSLLFRALWHWLAGLFAPAPR